jgi:hypothetical protein
MHLSQIKNGGKRLSLAATGIDFNRILLSAYYL